LKYSKRKLAFLIVISCVLMLVSFSYARFFDSPERRYQSIKKDLSGIFLRSSFEKIRTFSIDDSEKLLQQGFFSFYPAIIARLRDPGHFASDPLIPESLACLLLFYTDANNSADQRQAALTAFFFYLPRVWPSPNEFAELINLLNRHFRNWQADVAAESIVSSSWQLANENILPAVIDNAEKLSNFEAFFKVFPEIEAIINQSLNEKFPEPLKNEINIEQSETSDEDGC